LSDKLCNVLSIGIRVSMPVCSCGECVTEHLLLECEHYNSARQRYFSVTTRRVIWYSSLQNHALFPLSAV